MRTSQQIPPVTPATCLSSNGSVGARRPSRRHNRQGGELLIGIVILLAVAGVFVSWLASQSRDEARVAAGAKAGAQIAAIHEVIHQFTQKYLAEITASIAETNGSVSAGTLHVANETLGFRRIDERTIEMHAPALDTMMRILHARGVASTPTHGGSYRLHLRLIPSSRTGALQCAGHDRRDCFIETLIFTDTPLHINGHVDPAVLQAAVQTMGVGGGVSTPDVPGGSTGHQLRFAGGVVPESETILNPVERRPAGILAIVGSPYGQFRPYLLKSGGKMQGDIDMGGHDIHRIRRLQLEGGMIIENDTISAPSLTFRSPEAMFIDETGRDNAVHIREGNITAARIATSTLSASAITFKEAVLPGDTCTGKRIGFSAQDGLLYCQNERWTKLRKGEDGAVGQTGQRGLQGPQGKTGPQGDRGQMGPMGLPGDDAT